MWKLVKYELSYALSVLNYAKYYYLFVALIIVILLTNDFSDQSSIFAFVYTIISGLWLFLSPILIALFYAFCIHLPIIESIQNRTRLHASLPISAREAGKAPIIFQLMLLAIFLIYIFFRGLIDDLPMIFNNLESPKAVWWCVEMDLASFYQISMSLLIYIFALRLLFQDRTRLLGILCFSWVIFVPWSSNVISYELQEQFEKFTAFLYYTWLAIPVSMSFAFLIYQSYLRRESYLKCVSLERAK